MSICKVDVMRKKLIDEEKERTRIEEDNFIRLPVTKADRSAKLLSSAGASIYIYINDLFPHIIAHL